MAEQLSGHELLMCKRRRWAYDCYVRCGQDIDLAVIEFERTWNARRRKRSSQRCTHVKDLIKDAVAKMDSSYSLRTVASPGRTPRVARDVVMQCANLIAAGTMQPCSRIVDGDMIEWFDHRYFTSLHDAVNHSVALKAKMQEHDMKIGYLRKKLREHVTDLKWHSLYMRPPLSNRVLHERIMYSRHMNDFTAGGWSKFLDVHWMDECTIWVGGDLINRKLHVWSYRATTERQPPLINPLFTKSSFFKINILLVVNGRTGLTHVEVLTGTHGIEDNWRHNPEMQATMARRAFLYGDCKYKTKKSGYKEFAKSATKQEIYDNCKVWVPKQLTAAALEKRQCYVSWDNANIHKCGRGPNGLQGLGLQSHQYLKLPPLSPDLHQVIEHVFSQLKQHLVEEMYYARWDNVNPEWVRNEVIDWCKQIQPELIQQNLQKMPRLYHAVGTDQGQTVVVDGQRIKGTGGYYGKHADS